MPNTHPITRRRYWHFLKYTMPNPPRKEVSWTTEFGGKCRNGVGKAHRIPFTRKAIVFGKWVSRGEQATAMWAHEVKKCETVANKVEKELSKIIGPDTPLQKFGID